MFVAYTGYGRIATLGEEVREPRRTIPLAIIVTLVLTALLYLGVSPSALLKRKDRVLDLSPFSPKKSVEPS